MSKNLILLIFIMFMLSGCAMNEIEEYNVVSGMGIDYVDNNFIVTFELYDENKGETVELRSKIITGKGKQISEAMHNITKLMYQIPYLNHILVIIISENILKYKFSETLNYLIHDVRIRSSCYVIVSKDQTPQEVLEKSQQYGIVVSYGLFKKFDKSIRLAGIWSESSFDNVLNETIMLNGIVILPSIKQDRECDVTGAYAIKKDNEYVFADVEDVFVFQLFRDCVDEGYIEINNDYIYLKSIKSKISKEDNDIIIEINFKFLLYDLTFNIFNKEEKNNYINNLKEELQKQIINVFIKYKSINYDSCAIYKYLERYKPFLYNDIKENYYNYFDKINIKTKINIELLTSGLTEEKVE